MNSSATVRSFRLKDACELQPCNHQWLLLVFMLLGVVLPSEAQTESLATLANNQATIVKSHAFGNGTEVVIVRENWKSFKFWKINKTTGTAIMLDSIDNLSQGEVIPSKSGMFFTTSEFMPNGNDVKYGIKHIDTNGVTSVSDFTTIQYASNSSDYPPKLLAFHNDELLFIKFNHQNGKHQLVRDNQELTAHAVLSTFENPFQTFFIANDTFMFITKLPVYYEILSYDQVDGVQYRCNLPGTAGQGSVFMCGQKDEEAFFTVYIAAGHNQVWKTDFTPSGTSLYIDSLHVGSIRFEGNSFVLLDSHKERYCKGEYDHPEDMAPVPFAANLDPQQNYLDLFSLDTKYFRLLSHQYGIELGKFDNDTIRLAGDLFPGIGMGLTGIPDYANIMHMSMHVAYLEGTDTIFTVMSNGNDSLAYLYLHDGTDFKSYFPLQHPEEMIWLRIHGNEAYWLRNNASGLKLERRSLVSGTEPQPLSSIWEDSSLVWTTNLGYSSQAYGLWNADFNPDYNTGCKLLPDGGVLTCFNLREYYNERVLTTDGYISDSVNSSVIFTRYDRFGKVKWARSVGGTYTTFLELPRFATDSDGNILVAGPAFQKAYFGTDSIVVPRAMNYLAKLDGETGQILWKRMISEDYYSDDVIIEGITLDENNSIYLSIYFRQFSCNIDGATVQAMISPANALAKFSADGHVQELKTTLTPWTDQGGPTTVFSYNDVTKQIISTQVQGYYNVWSPCQLMDWNYLMQVVDTNGNVNKQQSFISDDIGSITTAVNHGENLVGFGYFRSRMDIGLFSESTMPTSSCFIDEGFMYTYSPEHNEINTYKTTISQPFYPLDSKVYGDYIYVYGTDQDNELVLIRFTASGEETGYIRLGQKADPFDWEKDQFFDVNDEYLVFLGNNFQADPAYDVFPAFGFCPYKTVIKTRNEGWKTDVKWFEDEQMTPFTSNNTDDAVVFPNPFDDEITLAFPKTGFSYDKYELLDINGKRIASGNLSGQLLQTIPFPGLARGSYLLHLKSGQEEKTIKLIKF